MWFLALGLVGLAAALMDEGGQPTNVKPRSQSGEPSRTRTEPAEGSVSTPVDVAGDAAPLSEADSVRWVATVRELADVDESGEALISEHRSRSPEIGSLAAAVTAKPRRDRA